MTLHVTALPTVKKHPVAQINSTCGYTIQWSMIAVTHYYHLTINRYHSVHWNSTLDNFSWKCLLDISTLIISCSFHVNCPCSAAKHPHLSVIIQKLGFLSFVRKWAKLVQNLHGNNTSTLVAKVHAHAWTEENAEKCTGMAKESLGRSSYKSCGTFQGRLLLVVIDDHSKWIEAVPVSCTSTAMTKQVLRRLFTIRRIPEFLISDNGTAFTGHEFCRFMHGK